MLSPTRAICLAFVLTSVFSALFVSAEAQESPIKLDYLYPDAFRTPQWIDVRLPGDAITIHKIRVITGNRAWNLRICRDRNDFPQSCVYSIPANAADGGHWRRDFVDKNLNILYTDLELTQKLHLWVDPVGGDQMIFRIFLELDIQ